MNIVFVLILILGAAFSRLVPHAPNFTAIISMALFSGVYLSGKSTGKKIVSILVPLGAMVLSDAIIGFYDLELMSFVYGSIVLISAVGLLFSGKSSVKNIAGSSILGAVIFFLVTNFGVWFVPGSMYPKTFGGLVESYIMGLPFFWNTLAGALFFSALLFGVYELGEKFAFRKKAAQAY